LLVLALVGLLLFFVDALAFALARSRNSFRFASARSLATVWALTHFNWYHPTFVGRSYSSIINDENAGQARKNKQTQLCYLTALGAVRDRLPTLVDVVAGFLAISLAIACIDRNIE
jgi:hypothetical protein